MSRDDSGSFLPHYAEAEIVGQPMRTLYLPEDAARGDAERDLEIARDNGRFEDARPPIEVSKNEMLAEPQRDITAETSARQLREQPPERFQA